MKKVFFYLKCSNNIIDVQAEQKVVDALFDNMKIKVPNRACYVSGDCVLDLNEVYLIKVE